MLCPVTESAPRRTSLRRVSGLPARAENGSPALSFLSTVAASSVVVVNSSYMNEDAQMQILLHVIYTAEGMEYV